MAIEKYLQALESRVAPLERVIELFAASLEEPKLRHHEIGFRYDAPDIRHFCLIKAVRVVSALNASFELARKGYTQEVATLMRTLVDGGRQIEYVLDSDDSEEHRSNVQKLVREFFEDSGRDSEAEIKSVLVRDKVINEQLGKTLDKIAAQHGDTRNRVPAKELFFKTSRTYSLYVHSRYPECMVYGGRPGRFHVRGMSGTPKDGENLEQLEVFVTVANTTFILMVQGLNLRALVDSDPMLAEWHRNWFDSKRSPD
ncbi:MAG: hypothetical protein ABSD08_18225 [Xanthobacteraceae bacterium]|jgi:hypothetical protein